MSAKHNPELFKLAMAMLSKQAFVPAQAGGGGAPPMDPSMAGGAPPMDPSMMGGAPGGDPSMGGGAPPMDPNALAAAMGPAQGGDPAAAGGAPPQEMAPDGLPMSPEPAAAPAPSPDDMKSKIKEVLTETGVIKAPKMKPEEQFNYIVQVLTALCNQMGVQVPPLPDAGSGDSGGSKDSKPASSSSSSSSSTKSAAVMSNGTSGVTSTQNLSHGDNKSSTTKLANALRRLRS